MGVGNRQRNDDGFPSHPGEPFSYPDSRTPERNITEEGVRQYTGPLYRISVSETDSQGTCTLVIYDPAHVVRVTTPVEFEQDGTVHAPTTHPTSGINGTYTFVFNKDEKHPILISPVIHLADGTDVRPGSETFDYDSASNIENVSVADKTVTSVTVTVQFDTDTAIGAGDGRYKIGAGSFILFSVASDLTGSFDVTTTGAQQTVTIQGKSLAGTWGPSVTITINAADASGGPSLDVKVVHGATTSVITWTGSGVLVSLNSGSPGSPGASPWTVTRPAAGAVSDAYAFTASRNGTTTTDTVFIPALDKDTVAPDISLSVVSSTATAITYSMVVTNPGGGAAAFVTLYGYYCSFTFNGSTYVNTSVGGSFGTGTSYTIVVTKPAAGNPTYSGATATLRIRAVISGGGGEEIARTIPNQDAVGSSGLFTSLTNVLFDDTTDQVQFSWAWSGPSASFYLSIMDIDGVWHQNVTTLVAGTTSYLFTSAFNITVSHADPLSAIAYRLSAIVGNTIIATSVDCATLYNHNP